MAHPGVENADRLLSAGERRAPAVLPLHLKDDDENTTRWPRDAVQLYYKSEKCDTEESSQGNALKPTTLRVSVTHQQPTPSVFIFPL